MKAIRYLWMLAFTVAGVTAQTDLPGKPGEKKQMLHVLDEITIVSTGTRTERLLANVPIKTEVLDRQLLDAASVSDLGSALELLNGARSEANCQNCGTAEIQLLGLPGKTVGFGVDHHMMAGAGPGQKDFGLWFNAVGCTAHVGDDEDFHTVILECGRRGSDAKFY